MLLRSKRVVIAGDPKQLPPRRFFESAISTSDDGEEIETDQQLFEIAAGRDRGPAGGGFEYRDSGELPRRALSLAERGLDRVQQPQFLQLAASADSGASVEPGTVFAVGNVSRRRGLQRAAERGGGDENQRDRARSAQARRAPPSIGIACFNITQRDLIIDKLEELAESDPAFGKSLAEARTRRVGGSFQGLFVKNLENIQGDERDHIIISTTYGPDEKGKFYKRFGPLGRAGRRAAAECAGDAGAG